MEIQGLGDRYTYLVILIVSLINIALRAPVSVFSAVCVTANPDMLRVKCTNGVGPNRT
jgi:hypothetical protein